jgi:dienelactone hydrolase
MASSVSKHSFDIAEGQTVDLCTPVSGPSDVTVLLWHGSGPRERGVMSPLAEEVAKLGASVYVPDWSSDAEDRGVADLFRSLDFVVSEIRREPSPSSRMVLAGWSAGASAAMAMALRGEEERRPSSVIAIAGRYDIIGPLGDDRPMNMSMGSPGEVSIRLIHGRHDTVVAAEQSELLFTALSGSGWSSSLTLVDADHAGVIGCRYDEERDLCVPSSDEGVQDVLRNVAALFGVASN